MPKVLGSNPSTRGQKKTERKEGREGGREGTKEDRPHIRVPEGGVESNSGLT